jgi:hypothetical protein
MPRLPAHPPDGPPVHATESPDAAAAPVPAALPTSLATLLASHILRDGELVLLVLRPSRWFILLSGLRFLTTVVILMILARVYDEQILHTYRQFLQAGGLLLAGRMIWAAIQWMSRLYVLTDQRILVVQGIFSVEVFDCPLRKVARTFLELTVKERICRIGSIAIVPQDDQMPLGFWRMIAQPRKTHQMIRATISRAKQGNP